MDVKSKNDRDAKAELKDAKEDFDTKVKAEKAYEKAKEDKKVAEKDVEKTSV